MNFGVALQTLGERESGTARLDEAATAYCEALQEYSRSRVPYLWAMTKMSLGTVLFRLGERQSGTAQLEEATTVFREALQENTRECQAARLGQDSDESRRRPRNIRYAKR
jgi:hypothetical protein